MGLIDSINENIEFLNYIYQNAEMDKDTTKQLIDISKDKEIKYYNSGFLFK